MSQTIIDCKSEGLIPPMIFSTLVKATHLLTATKETLLPTHILPTNYSVPVLVSPYVSPLFPCPSKMVTAQMSGVKGSDTVPVPVRGG